MAGTRVEATRDYPLNEAERNELTLKFNRMVEALEMTAFVDLVNSPIAAPPWDKTSRPTEEPRSLDDKAEAY